MTNVAKHHHWTVTFYDAEKGFAFAVSDDDNQSAYIPPKLVTSLGIDGHSVGEGFRAPHVVVDRPKHATRSIVEPVTWDRDVVDRALPPGADSAIAGHLETIETALDAIYELLGYDRDDITEGGINGTVPQLREH